MTQIRQAYKGAIVLSISVPNSHLKLHSIGNIRLGILFLNLQFYILLPRFAIHDIHYYKISM